MNNDPMASIERRRPLQLLQLRSIVSLARRRLGTGRTGAEATTPAAPAAPAHESRLMIARDLHDLVANRMALILIHARDAESRVRCDRGPHDDALRLIESAATAALRDLRDLIGALRYGPAASQNAWQNAGNSGGRAGSVSAGIDAVIAELRSHHLTVAVHT